MKTKHDKIAAKLGHKTLNGVCVDAEKHRLVEHTPTPWIEGIRDDSKPKAMIDPTFQGNYINIDPGNGGNGVSAVCQVIGPDREANATFIVRAANCHEELLLAVKGFRNYLKLDGRPSDELDELIVKAEGVESNTKAEGK